MFVVVKLLGKLGQKFGREFRFDISTPREAVRALCANFPGFAQELAESETRNVGYRVVSRDGDCPESELDYPIGTKVIHIVPAVFGSGGPFWNIIAGVALIGIGIFSGFAPLALLGAALVLRGISELLSPQPKTEEDQKSFLFGGPLNTEGQGGIMPLCYGRILIGSQVISASVTTDQISVNSGGGGSSGGK